MARTTLTASDLTVFAERLTAAASTVAEIANNVRESGAPGVLVHSGMVEHRHLPEIEGWVNRLQIDIRGQLGSYLAGVPSKAELDKLRSARQQKSAASKKPPAQCR